MTLFELRAALAAAKGVRVHHFPSRTFCSGLASQTKKSLVATERRLAKVSQRRAQWFKHGLRVIVGLPDRVVFIVETAVKTNLMRLRCRAKRGQRLTLQAPFGSWGKQRLIADLTPDALIAPWVIKGAMDGPAFAAYSRDVIIPGIAPSIIVIPDDLAMPRNRQAAQALRDHGC